MASVGPAAGYRIEPQQVVADLSEPTLVSFLDMARWMAAAMVVVAHTRAMLLLSYPNLVPEDQTLWVKAWYFVTGFHGEGVMVFFVLSGFLVGGLSTARAQQGRFDPGSYAIDRFTRLFIAFIPAVLLTLVLDRIGAGWFDATGIYDATNPLIVEKVNAKAFEDFLGLPLVLGNLLMLQHYFMPMLGSNEPLWTLSTEFWFYVVFGALLTATLTKGAKRWAFVFVGLGASAALGIAKEEGEFIGWCVVWAIGLAAACIRPGRTGPWYVPLAAVLAWLAFMRLNTDVISPNDALIFATDYVLAVLFAWLILAMRNTRLALLERLGRFNKAMADFSYSLYLVHHPLLMFLVAMLGTLTGLAGFAAGFEPDDPIGLALYAGLLIAIFGLCWLFAQATERHTGRLRRWMKRKLLG